ncbi:MAG: 16S rRNA (cytosine(967)-C(5))-methyltransferase RsmB [Luminiphilus sp.]|nr:16S rRNA (cytosine(967)-C(5))-methyltransferase RsmB [Luminiphilus sp.]
MTTPVRVVASNIIHRVIQGESLHTLLPSALDAAATVDRPLCQELVYGTLREWPLLAPLCQSYMKKPLRRKDSDIKTTICVGLYELSHLNTPAHAVVSETVNAARALGKSWAAGLVNGILRNHQRRSEPLSDSLSLAQCNAMPDWLFDQLVAQHGDRIDDIATAARSRPPMVLRVNNTQVTRDDYLGHLAETGIEAIPCSEQQAGITLAHGVDVMRLPGFLKGWVSVQDQSAQCVPQLLDPRPGERILDACAAPGGKACHLLEHEPALDELVACDISESRLTKVAESSQRLGLQIKTVVADARELPRNILSTPFDAILADVPCSATGVMRRNPDIKVLRRADDISGFAAQQLAILRGLWPALKPGGRLLYVTCSILQQENDDVVRLFGREQAVTTAPLELNSGLPTALGWQTLPRADGGDGLYFALLQKS